MREIIWLGSSMASFTMLAVACGSDTPEGVGSSSSSSGVSADDAAASGSTSSGASSGHGGSSSSSGGTSSGGSSSSSSSSGDAAAVCPEPLPPTIDAPAAAQCGALPVGPEAEAVAGQALGAVPVFTGGVIPPGQYELVKAETTLAGTPRYLSVLVFDAQGTFSENAIEYDLPGAGTVAHDAQGAWTTNGSTVTLARSCEHSTLGPVGTNSGGYSVREDGCEVFLETGGTAGEISVRLTYQRRHQ